MLRVVLTHDYVFFIFLGELRLRIFCSPQSVWFMVTPDFSHGSILGILLCSLFFVDLCHVLSSLVHTAHRHTEVLMQASIAQL